MRCNRLLRVGTAGTIGMGLLMGLGAQATPVPNHPGSVAQVHNERTAASTELDGFPSEDSAEPATHNATNATNATATTDAQPLPITRRHNLTVQPGDSLSGLFSQAGLRPREWADVLKLGRQVAPLENLDPGDVLEIRKTPDGELAELRFDLDAVDTLSVHRDDDGLKADVVQLDSYTRRLSARGTIKDSLSDALSRADVPAAIANQLADIYRYRADLSTHMAPGDRFSIIYDAQFTDGKRVAAGPIVAAKITTDGQDIEAFHATTADGKAGYYDSEGQSFQPAFSRRPVDYTRISSPFDLNRMHPVLRIHKPHNGVDMAATRGTAIHAAADGTVKFVGRMAGYGRLVELDNFDGYSTRYGHMFRFADDLEKGDAVEAGQIIGYVGSSGVATGSHLHFEIRKDGTPHNPLTMALPDGDPLPEDRLAVFTNRIQPLAARLDDVPGMPKTLIASNAGLANRGNCRQSGTINAALALAPASALENHSLNELFCVMTRGSNA